MSGAFLYNRRMVRFWLSIVGGIVIPFTLAVIKLRLTEYPSLNKIVTALDYLLFWPILLWGQPSYSDCVICPLDYPSIAAIVFNVLAFSLLTYAFLSWRNIPKRLR